MALALQEIDSLIQRFNSEPTKLSNRTISPLSQRSRWSRSRREFSPKERVRRKVRAVCSKLCTDNKDRLLPSILKLYDEQIDDISKLKICLNHMMEQSVTHIRKSPIVQRPVVMESPVAESQWSHQDVFIDVILQLSLQKHRVIEPLQFQNCVKGLCDEYFFKFKSSFHGMGRLIDRDEWVFEQSVLAMQATSTVEFIARLIGEGIIEYEAFGNYLYELMSEGVNDTNIASICGAFRGISKLWKSKMESSVIENVSVKRPCTCNEDRGLLSVQRESHLLGHGYIRRQKLPVSVPVSLIDICVAFYDVHWYIMECYQFLRRISVDREHYTPRVCLLTTIMLTFYE